MPWSDVAGTFLWLATGGVCGTLLRGGLQSLFSCYASLEPNESCSTLASGGVLFLALVPNAVGCFVAGLVSTPFAAGAPVRAGEAAGTFACLRPDHPWQRLDRLHVGVRVGLCGALTTWASWNEDMCTRLVTGRQPAGALLGYVIGAHAAGASLLIGHHAAVACWHTHRGGGWWRAADAEAEGSDAFVDRDIGETCVQVAQPAAWCAEDAAVLLVLCAAMSGCIAALVRSRDASARALCLGAVVSPAGVLLRWWLGGRLNGRIASAAWLPAGTLAANTLACLLDAALDVGFARGQLGRGAYWGAILNTGLQAGIGGGLSTVSSAAAEAALLMAEPAKRYRGYLYIGATFILGIVPACLLLIAAT